MYKIMLIMNKRDSLLIIDSYIASGSVIAYVEWLLEILNAEIRLIALLDIVTVLLVCVGELRSRLSRSMHKQFIEYCHSFFKG